MSDGKSSGVCGLLCLAALFLAGCGGSKEADVTGTVEWAGKPVTQGVIDFEPTDGKGSTVSAEVRDGKYTAVVPCGKKIIRVYAFEVVGTRKVYETPDSPVMDVQRQIIPEKWNAQSVLEYEVTDDKQTFDFLK